MLAPAVVLVPLLWLDAIPARSLSTLLHGVMLPLMLVVLLWRRSRNTSEPGMRTRFRIHMASLGLPLPPVAVGATGTAGQFASLHHPPAGTAAGAPQVPPDDDRKIDRGNVATRG